MRERFRLPTSRRQVERDLEDELALHASLRQDALVRQGLSPDAARLEAARQFGDAVRVREECLAIDEAHRAVSTRRQLLDEIRQDTRIAWRSLGRDRSLLVTMLLVVALGIGASTSVFSLYRGVVMRPLPVAHPERTAWITVSTPSGNDGVSPAVAHLWRDASRTLESLATSREVAMTLLGEGEPLRVEGLQVGRGFVTTLGLQPTSGRGFTADDYASGAQPVALLAHGLWLDRFGGDPRVVGTSVSLDGMLHTVVGILPTTVEGLGTQPQFLVPDPLPDGLRDNFTPFLEVVGLVREDVPLQEAETELQGILERGAAAAGKDLEGRRARLETLGNHLSSPFRGQLQLLLAAVLAVWLIGCVNGASLLLARGAGRGRELAVRAALGASRGRLARQLLTEHVIVAVLGGLAGLALAVFGTGALVAILPPELPRLRDVQLDAGSVAFAVAATIVTALAAGLFPAWQVSRVSPGGMLREGGRGATGGTSNENTRRALVVLEIALSAVLLVGATLLLRSAQQAGRVAPGFSIDSVSTARYALSAREYPSAESVVDAHQRVLSTLRETDPDAVALTSSIPLGNGGGGSDFRVLGGSTPASIDVNAQLRFVSPGYLRVMGIALIAGRDLANGDNRTAAPRLLISETLAQRLGLGVNAVGRMIGGTSSPFQDSTGSPVPYEVVGVVREPRDGGLRSDPVPQVFIPLAQTPAEVFYWSARSVHIVWRPGTTTRTRDQVAAAVHRIDPTLPLFDVRTMRERLRASLALEQASTALLTALGVAAALLAASGLYGVVSYHVRQREREFGVRMALGAHPGDIITLVLRWGGAVTLVGLGIGIPVALAGARSLRALLFGVTPWDVPSVLAVIGLLAAATALACVAPARRASRIPPDAALRR